MPRTKVLLGTLLLFALSLLLGCGKISIGSSVSHPVPELEDWRYQAQPWPYDSTTVYHTAARMSAEQATLYRELTDELSLALNRNRQAGSGDLSPVWPVLDSQRIHMLAPRYDAGSRLLEWRYENLGDYNLDSLVLTTDLKPVAMSAIGPQPLELDRNTRLDWLDREQNGMLGTENVADISYSYGRRVSGYNVFAGATSDVSAMTWLGLSRLADSLPGWPPAFQLHLPAGYGYACIQPVAETRIQGELIIRPLCNYVLDLSSGAPGVQVFDATLLNN